MAIAMGLIGKEERTKQRVQCSCIVPRALPSRTLCLLEGNYSNPKFGESSNSNAGGKQHLPMAVTSWAMRGDHPPPHKLIRCGGVLLPSTSLPLPSVLIPNFPNPSVSLHPEGVNSLHPSFEGIVPGVASGFYVRIQRVHSPAVPTVWYGPSRGWHEPSGAAEVSGTAQHCHCWEPALGTRPARAMGCRGLSTGWVYAVFRYSRLPILHISISQNPCNEEKAFKATKKYRKCNKCKKRIMWKMHWRNVFLAVEMLAVALLHEYLETRSLAPNVSLNVHSFPCYKYYILFQDSRMQKSSR